VNFNLREEEALGGRGCFSVSEILPLLCSSTPLFPTPPLVSPKIPHVPLGVGGWPLGYGERRCWASKISNLYACGPDPPTSQTRQTMCNRNTALHYSASRGKMSPWTTVLEIMHGRLLKILPLPQYTQSSVVYVAYVLYFSTGQRRCLSTLSSAELLMMLYAHCSVGYSRRGPSLSQGCCIWTGQSFFS